MSKSPYTYTKWINTAILEVIKKTITTLAKHGLHGNIHFYLTFNTNHSSNKLPDYLKNKYPDTMTIVLQNQFYNLDIDKNGFFIELSFSGKLEKIYICWASIISLLDPETPISLVVENTESKKKQNTVKVEQVAEPQKDESNIIKFPPKK